MKKYTPDNITELFENEVMVYGSNQYAKHAGGLAYVAAEKFGAINENCPIGLCGQSYGIITTSFSDLHISLEFIKSQIEVLYYFALLRTDLTFYCSKIGCGIAGFSIKEIASLFKSMPFKPTNIILPIEF